MGSSSKRSGRQRKIKSLTKNQLFMLGSMVSDIECCFSKGPRENMQDGRVGFSSSEAELVMDSAAGGEYEIMDAITEWHLPRSE